MAHLHQSRVLVDDLALRNVVIAHDFTLKLIDFGQSVVLPMDTELSRINVDGLTAKFDIFRLGCLIYSVAAWHQFENDSFSLESRFPSLDKLPAIDHLRCAVIIHKCWTGRYADMEELRTEATQKLAIGVGDIISLWFRRFRTLLISLQSSLPESL